MKTDYLVTGVRISINTSHSSTWEEIDAVQLVADSTLTEIMQGSAAADYYQFHTGNGQAIIVDNDASLTAQDSLSFDAGIDADQLWLRQVGNDLEVSIIGTADKVTIADWYNGAAFHVESLKIGSGEQLLDSSVQNLVQAMAAFSPPAAGQTTLPTAYQSSLSSVIAANWN